MNLYRNSAEILGLDPLHHDALGATFCQRLTYFYYYLRLNLRKLGIKYYFVLRYSCLKFLELAIQLSHQQKPFLWEINFKGLVFGYLYVNQLQQVGEVFEWQFQHRESRRRHSTDTIIYFLRKYLLRTSIDLENL